MKMLKEMVNLIATSSVIGTLSSEGQDISIKQDDELAIAIKEATDAIGRHDEQKRKTDEAVCLLFRAAELMRTNEGDADKLLARAERLLGFAQLEPAKS